MSGVSKEKIDVDIAAASAAAAAASAAAAVALAVASLPASATLRSASWAIVLNEINRWDGVTNGLTALFPAAPANGDRFGLIGVGYAPATTLLMDGNGKTLLTLAPSLPLFSTSINVPLVFVFDAYTNTWWLEADFLLLGLAQNPNSVATSDVNGVLNLALVDPNSALARVGAASLASVNMARFGGAFVYKPSAGAPVGGEGRLFSDWPSLWTAVQLTVGHQVIWIDEDASITDSGSGYDFERRVALAARKGITATTLTVGDGANAVNFRNLIDVFGSLTLVNGHLGAVVMFVDGTSPAPQITFHDGGGIGAIAGNSLFLLVFFTTMNLYFNGRGNKLGAATAPDTAGVGVAGGGKIDIRLQGEKGTIDPGALASLDASPLGSKIRIFDYGNPNGLISKVQNALTGNFGGLEYPNFAPEVFHFQGDLSAAVADDCLISNFVLSLATSKNVPGVIATPDPEVEHIVSHENQLRQIAWISDSVLDATTELEILVDGVVVLTTGATVPLVGRVGTQTLLPFNPAPPYASLVVKGPTVNNRIAVRYRAGTVPGKISVRIQ